MHKWSRSLYRRHLHLATVHTNPATIRSPRVSPCSRGMRGQLKAEKSHVRYLLLSVLIAGDVYVILKSRQWPSISSPSRSLRGSRWTAVADPLDVLGMACITSRLCGFLTRRTEGRVESVRSAMAYEHITCNSLSLRGLAYYIHARSATI